MGKNYDDGLIKGEDNGFLSLKDFIDEIDWIIAENTVCNYKIYGNVIVLKLSNGQKFRLTVNEVK